MDRNISVLNSAEDARPSKKFQKVLLILVFRLNLSNNYYLIILFSHCTRFDFIKIVPDIFNFINISIN